MKRILGPIPFILGTLCFADSAHPVLTVALDVRGSITQPTLQEMQREIRKALFTDTLLAANPYQLHTNQRRSRLA